MPSTLYHYCTLDSLLGIVQNKSIWAGDVRFLNDREEIREAKKHMLRNIDIIENHLKDLPGCREVIGSLKRVCSQNHLLFATSFSKEGDNLSQWRCYGDRGRGVCLGFDEALIRSLGHRVDKMLYSADELLEAVVTTGKQCATSAGRTQSELKALDRRFIEMTALSKNPAFKDEREFRLLILDGDPGAGDRRFRRSGQFITSYRPISLETLWKDMVLKELCVGPCQHEKDTQWAITQFLEEMESTAAVYKSTAPFREW